MPRRKSKARQYHHDIHTAIKAIESEAYDHGLNLTDLPVGHWSERARLRRSLSDVAQEGWDYLTPGVAMAAYTRGYKAGLIERHRQYDPRED